MKIKTYKNREEIDKKYKWDLDSLYPSMTEYNADLDKLKQIVKKMEKYKGKVLASSSNLYELLVLNLEQEQIFNKLANFIHLNCELDTRNDFYSAKMGELTDFYSDIELKLNFISEELKALTKDILDKFMKENSKLKDYEFILRCTIRANAHLLSLESENLLTKLSPVLYNGDEVFSLLDDADSVYDDVVDSKGKKHKLTNGTYARYMSGSDRVLRKNAALSLHEYYKKHANTLSSCLYNHVKTSVITSSLRMYSSPLARELEQDDLTLEFYDKFIKSVNDNLSTLHRMMKLTKKALKLNTLHIYDIGTKLADGVKVDYTIEEMQDILLKALAPLGEEYIAGVREAFSSNWVDYYETPGKRSGAFSTVTTTTKPYLLLNYTGSFNDLETFAHELGHSMHTYFANKYRTPIDADYPIFLAEIASTTNELLLNNYLLKTTNDKKFKRYLLSNLISMYRATIFRQTEFSEFESTIYKLTEEGKNLTKEDFTSIYYDLQKKYYGPLVVQDDYIKYECLRIPHMYYTFYVYKYATSLAIAYHFAYAILSNKEGAVENYLHLLKSGGKDYPANILKECGIDINSNDILDYSIKMINNYMDEFEKLI